MVLQLRLKNCYGPSRSEVHYSDMGICRTVAGFVAVAVAVVECHIAALLRQGNLLQSALNSSFSIAN